jgi:hypothetical protein
MAAKVERRRSGTTVAPSGRGLSRQLGMPAEVRVFGQQPQSVAFVQVGRERQMVVGIVSVAERRDQSTEPHPDVAIVTRCPQPTANSRHGRVSQQTRPTGSYRSQTHPRPARLGAHGRAPQVPRPRATPAPALEPDTPISGPTATPVATATGAAPPSHRQPPPRTPKCLHGFRKALQPQLTHRLEPNSRDPPRHHRHPRRHSRLARA